MKIFPYFGFAIAASLLHVIVLVSVFAQSGDEILDAKTKATSLCAPTEQVMFTCQVAGRSLSINLAGPEMKQSQLSYRFGIKGEVVDMEIPAANAGAQPDLFAEYPAVLGGSGGLTRLGAKNGDVEYVVYLNEHKFDLPAQGAGVAVLTKGKQQAILACTSVSYADSEFWSLATRRDIAVPTPFPNSLDEEVVALPSIARRPCGEM